MFSRLDLFRKVNQDLQNQMIQSLKGGFIFTATLIIMMVLLFSEFYDLMYGPPLKTQFIHQYHPDERIRVNLNITFPQLACHSVSMDYQDVTNTHLEDIQHTITKLRLFPSGEYAEPEKARKARQQEMRKYYPNQGYFAKDEETDIDSTNCYGAELFIGQQCITCQDVMIAYSARGWPQPMQQAIGQCMPGHKPVVVVHDYYEYDPEAAKRKVEEQERLRFQALKHEMDQLTDPSELIDEETMKYLDQGQRLHLESQLKQLNELQFNPMSWSQQRLDQQKMKRVDELLTMLHRAMQKSNDQERSKLGINISKPLLNFEQDGFQINQTKLLTSLHIHRELCEHSVNFKLNITLTLSKNKTHYNMTDLMQLQPNQCLQSIDFYFTKLSQEKFVLTSKEIKLVKEIDVYFLYQFGFSLFTLTGNQLLPHGGRDTQLIVFVNNDNQIVQDFEKHHQRLQQTQEHLDQINKAIDGSNNKENQAETEDVQPNRRNLFTEEYGNEQFAPKPMNIFDLQRQMFQIMNQQGEGCQVFGHIYIKKVPGNFHFSFHNQAYVIVNNFYDMSHRINVLEFTTRTGRLTLGSIVQPSNYLDNTVHSSQAGTDHDYYLKIVNAVYNDIFSGDQDLYVFTAYENSMVREPTTPSVSFKYDFQPVSMKYHRKSNSIPHFLVSICAIVGGIFALSQYIYNIVS